jgi:hypothetical protein
VKVPSGLFSCSTRVGDSSGGQIAAHTQRRLDAQRPRALTEFTTFLRKAAEPSIGCSDNQGLGNPNPKWVAPPGTSLHRYATELDLGPSTAYARLEANCGRFGFTRRYAWEPWQTTRHH